jgi:hypothetical protein
MSRGVSSYSMLAPPIDISSTASARASQARCLCVATRVSAIRAVLVTHAQAGLF